MLFTIDHVCGHCADHQIYGTNTHGEREIKAEKLAKTLCPECYAKQQASQNEGHAVEEKEMSYREYKTDYPNNKTKPGSYDSKYKTIIVYV